MKPGSFGCVIHQVFHGGNPALPGIHAFPGVRAPGSRGALHCCAVGGLPGLDWLALDAGDDSTPALQDSADIVADKVIGWRRICRISLPRAAR